MSHVPLSEKPPPKPQLPVFAKPSKEQQKKADQAKKEKQDAEARPAKPQLPPEALAGSGRAKKQVLCYHHTLSNCHTHSV